MTLAGSLEGSLEQGMLSGEPGTSQSSIVNISQEGMVSDIVLFSPSGKIAASSTLEDIGQITDSKAVFQTLQSGKSYIDEVRQNSNHEFWVITPVLNETKCQGCHAQETAVLGAIKVGLDATPLDNQAREEVIFICILGFIAFLIVGVGGAFALRKQFLNPLSRLAESAQTFSQGDYSLRTPSDSNDEIGMLAKAFNEMASNVEQRTRDLENSQRDLARLNMNLEGKVEQRTKELTALNSVLTTVTKSLDISKILNAALLKILSLVDIEAGMIHLLDTTVDQSFIMANLGFQTKYVQENETLKLVNNIAQETVLTGEPVVYNDTKETANITSILGDQEEFRTYVTVPVKSSNKVLGSLSLASYPNQKFSEETVDLLGAMGDALGIAVENALTVKSLRDANEQFHELVEQAVTGGFEASFHNPYLIQCWEETNCSQHQCPSYKSENQRCWQVAGTHCNGKVQGYFAQKYESCMECEVYRKSCYRDELTMIGESFNNMVFLLQYQTQSTERLKEQFLERLISAQEEERRRIARELHDAASQSLAALALNLEAISSDLPSKYRDTRERLDYLKSQAIETMSGIRQLALELRPSILDDLGLARAIRSYANEYLGNRGINVKFNFTGSTIKLPAYTETMLFRIAQEALFNIVKHAEAKEVVITLNLDSQLAMMQLKDDGKGFDTEANLKGMPVESLGLYSMSERAMLLGGVARIESEVGKGTCVRVEIPLGDTNISHE